MKEDQDNNVIVVAWDFTHVSDYALAHAVKIAGNRGYEIKLLHVVKPGAPSEEIENARRKMTQVCNDTLRYNGINCKLVVKEGNVYSTISEYATQSNTKLVVMGTHGRKGSQKVFGSKALRVIVGSNTPFLVVKSKPTYEEAIMPNVVFPICFKSENKEKLQWAIYIGEHFKSKIHLFKYPITESNLQKKVNVNLNFAIRFLKQHAIDYEIHSAPRKTKFYKESVNYAEQINADMIIITTTKHIGFIDYWFGATEQKVIDNSAKIPVLCVNPRVGATTGSLVY